MAAMRYRFISYFFALLLLGVLWEWSAKNYPSVRLLLSSPSWAYEYAISNMENLSLATISTLWESTAGFTIATIFSFVVMSICLYLPRIIQVILPVMIVSQVIPLITLAPLLILIFGIGLSSKIVMAGIMAFFPIFVNFATGIGSISLEIRSLMFVYNASKSFQIVRVFFPLSMPNIFGGLKISATLSVIGAIVAEFNGAEFGLGKNLFLAARRLEPDLMICSFFLSAILGGGMYAVIHFLERKLGKWYILDTVEEKPDDKSARP
jgi:NitT/TauT family transport system permease protein